MLVWKKWLEFAPDFFLEKVFSPNGLARKLSYRQALCLFVLSEEKASQVLGTNKCLVSHPV